MSRPLILSSLKDRGARPVMLMIGTSICPGDRYFRSSRSQGYRRDRLKIRWAVCRNWRHNAPSWGFTDQRLPVACFSTILKELKTLYAFAMFCSATSLSVEWYRGGKEGEGGGHRVEVISHASQQTPLDWLYNGGELQPRNVCHSEPNATATN